MTSPRRLTLLPGLLASFILLTAPVAAQTPLDINTVRGTTRDLFFHETVAMGPDGRIYFASFSHASVILATDPYKATLHTVFGNGYQTGSLDGEGGDSRDDLGDGLPATKATAKGISNIAFDPDGNLLFVDRLNYRIRRVDAQTGIVETIVGNGIKQTTGDGGPASQAGLSFPFDLVFDSQGNMILTDSHRIRLVTPADGIIRTIAGGDLPGFQGDWGPARHARFFGPLALAVDGQDNLFIVDRFNYRVRRIEAATGLIHTIAGDGTSESTGDGGPATAAGLGLPRAVAISPDGFFLVSESWADRVRMVDMATGIIGPFAGTGVETGSIDGPGGDPADDLGDGGPATEATLHNPHDIAIDSGGLVYIVDRNNHRIRRVAGDLPPVADAGPDRDADCISQDRILVSLDGSASFDPDAAPGTQDGIVSWEWFEDFGLPTETWLGAGKRLEVELPLGIHTITLVVTDLDGLSGEDTVLITGAFQVVGFDPPMPALIPEGDPEPSFVPSFHRGSVLPLRMQLTCGRFTLTRRQMAPAEIVALERDGLPLDLAGLDLSAGAGHDGPLFRSRGRGWIFSMTTAPLEAGEYRLRVELEDGRRYVARFDLSTGGRQPIRRRTGSGGR